MNRNEFENWMKDKMGNLPILSTEERWIKLQTDLQQPRAKQKKAFLLPWMKIAAAVLVILSLGLSTLYLMRDQPEQDHHTVIVQEKAGIPSLPSQNPDRGPAPAITHTTDNRSRPQQTFTPGKRNLPFRDTFKPTTQDEINAPVMVRTDKKEPGNAELPAPEHGKREVYPSNNPGRILQPVQDKNLLARKPENIRSVNLGMSANIGRSTISQVGYQVGVVGRGNLSKRVFVEAGLSVTSNTVSYSSNRTFPGMELGFDGLGNTTTNTQTQIQADYARNVIALGLTPSAGIQVTQRFSIATGGALYRNLNPSLELTNGKEIISTALDKNIISTSKKISNWDIGITCNADYKVTRNLSFNINYRKGLSDYLQKDNQYIKNSGLQLGLKYLFGKQE